MPVILGIRIEFILFALSLLGVAAFHRRTMELALSGFLIILLLKIFFDSGFHVTEHFLGQNSLLMQLENKELRSGEWILLLNLFGLLMGFTILAKHFEASRLPELLPAILPDDWKGGLLLIFFVMLISSFLDNIAAAMIGGTIAMVVYKGRLHLGFLAAIIAAANAGGAGSVLGDTTTTLMWIDGVAPVNVTHAYIASFTAFIIFGTIASLQQDKFQRINKDATLNVKLDLTRLLVVVLILVLAVASNWAWDFPALGVWVAIMIGALITGTPWGEARKAFKGSIFLLALVASASMMPVTALPKASISSAFVLGFVSAVFDNIPLTKLCLDQGGYDWGVLAYSVGFGGSMIWFGSSAGVALSNMFPETKNTLTYLKKGWHIIPAYIAGFYMMIAIAGWNPQHPHKAIPGKIDKPELIIRAADPVNKN